MYKLIINNEVVEEGSKQRCCKYLDAHKFPEGTEYEIINVPESVKMDYKKVMASQLGQTKKSGI